MTKLSAQGIKTIEQAISTINNLKNGELAAIHNCEFTMDDKKGVLLELTEQGYTKDDIEWYGDEGTDTAVYEINYEDTEVKVTRLSFGYGLARAIDAELSNFGLNARWYDEVAEALTNIEGLTESLSEED